MGPIGSIRLRFPDFFLPVGRACMHLPLYPSLLHVPPRFLDVPFSFVDVPVMSLLHQVPLPLDSQRQLFSALWSSRHGMTVVSDQFSVITLNRSGPLMAEK